MCVLCVCVCVGGGGGGVGVNTNALAQVKSLPFSFSYSDSVLHFFSLHYFSPFPLGCQRERIHNMQLLVPSQRVLSSLKKRVECCVIF